VQVSDRVVISNEWKSKLKMIYVDFDVIVTGEKDDAKML
jgi:hypothetical protein